jgi:hypothetical protein
MVRPTAWVRKTKRTRATVARAGRRRRLREDCAGCHGWSAIRGGVLGGGGEPAAPMNDCAGEPEEGCGWGRLSGHHAYLPGASRQSGLLQREVHLDRLRQFRVLTPEQTKPLLKGAADHRLGCLFSVEPSDRDPAAVRRRRARPPPRRAGGRSVGCGREVDGHWARVRVADRDAPRRQRRSQGLQGTAHRRRPAEHAASRPPPRHSDSDHENCSISSGEVVSREGIEPSTRRLRVCCSAN